MPTLPEPIERAAGAFDSLPGLGPRASLRYVYWLMTQPKEVIRGFARAIEALANTMERCAICHQWAEQSPCRICRDTKRDHSVMCVVATSQDARTIEETGLYKGVYHVLNGTIDPLEGRGPETLTIGSLFQRLEAASSPIREAILAFDADVPGDATTLYLKKALACYSIKITGLARGIPSGAQLEYIDPHTLRDAFAHRQESSSPNPTV